MRIRTVKPEFWSDEDMATVSEPAERLAVALLNYADDEGYFNANTLLIKAALYPLREPSVSIPVMLQELSKIGYIQLFDADDGKIYGLVVNFVKHQTISHSKPSEIKKKCRLLERSSNVPVTLHEPSTLNGMEWNGTGNGMEWNGNPEIPIHSSSINSGQTNDALPEKRGPTPLEADPTFTHWICEIWKDFRPKGLPACRDWTLAHHQAALKLMENYGNMDTLRDRIEEAITDKIGKSDYLMGRTDQKFKANISWLLGMSGQGPAGLVKLCDGAYDNRGEDEEDGDGETTTIQMREPNW